MNRTDFSYELPPELIAQRPSTVRGESRLCHLPLSGEPVFTNFGALLDLFQGNELLVLNDTKVVPARVMGQKPTGGKVEVLVVEPLEGGRIAAMVRGSHMKPGAQILLPGGVQATFVASGDEGTVELQMSGLAEGPDALWAWLDQAGEMPLPPYIERAADASDRDRYQTVFADEPGAVAAPTAGLHFTPEMLETLTKKGVEIAKVTLHVGPGTFRPVKVDRIEDHKMHAERYTVSEKTAEALARAKREGRPIVAVGTTVVRTLESYALDPTANRTSIFIYPGFKFQLVDGLITNFHLPESTLLMLVCAFSGQERVLDAYRAAVREGMHFFSYGDAMFMHRAG